MNAELLISDLDSACRIDMTNNFHRLYNILINIEKIAPLVTIINSHENIFVSHVTSFQEVRIGRKYKHESRQPALNVYQLTKLVTQHINKKTLLPTGVQLS